VTLITLNFIVFYCEWGFFMKQCACVCISLTACLSVWLCICFSTGVCVWLCGHLSVSLFVYMSQHLSVCVQSSWPVCQGLPTLGHCSSRRQVRWSWRSQRRSTLCAVSSTCFHTTSSSRYNQSHHLTCSTFSTSLCLMWAHFVSIIFSTAYL